MATKEKGINEYSKQKQSVENLLTSSKNGDYDCFIKEIEKMKMIFNISDINELLISIRDAHKRAAIHFAAINGRKNILKYILTVAPNCINLFDEENITPLHYAVRSNEFMAAKILIEAGANVSLVCKKNISLAHEAAANGSIRMLDLLLNHAKVGNIQLESKTANGTPLHFSISENQLKMVDYLIMNKNVNINAKNNNGITPLILATLMRKIDIVQTILDKINNNIDFLTCTIMGGITALHIAAETGFNDIITIFINKINHHNFHTLCNIKSDDNITPLQLAAGMDHMETVKLLLPYTDNYENMNLNDIIIKEKERMDKNKSIEIEKNEPQNENDISNYHKNIDDIEGIIPEKDIIIPIQNESNKPSDKDIELSLKYKEEGNILHKNKNYNEAILMYTKAIEINPFDPIFYSNRSASYLLSNEKIKSLSDIRICKKMKPDWIKVHFREGQCLESMEYYENAANAYWMALKLSPNDKKLKKIFQDCITKGRNEYQLKNKTSRDKEK